MSLDSTIHYRPWPRPRTPWVLAMRWHDLLFMHWPVPPAWLRPHIPARLTLDTFAGTAWLGVVPFHMTGVGPRGLTWLPGLSAFPELNVRTYVQAEGKPGVWFFSLDATNPLAVRGARAIFHLPYMQARMAVRHEGDTIRYTSCRTQRGTSAAAFQGCYRPCGPVFLAQPGTLEHWLTARYCLYSMNRAGHVFRGEIDHAPWPLQAATAAVTVNTMTQPLGFDVPATPPLLHFARCLEVVAWLLERVPC